MRHMRFKYLLPVAFCVLALGSGSPSMGTTGAPFGQWRTFPMGRPAHCGGITWCASSAANAMRLTNLTSHPTQPDKVTAWGANNDTLVVVVCTPVDDTRVSATLFASSESQSNATFWADQIRSKMRAAGCL